MLLAQSTPYFIPPSASTSTSPNERPIEFVTIVLRAAVQGLLKCCCLSWIELSKGGVYDVRFRCFLGLNWGSNPFFPLDRRLAKRQVWHILIGRDPCIFHYFQTRWGSELVRAKWFGWNLFSLSEEKKVNYIFSVWILENCITSQDSSPKSMVSPLSTFVLSWNINLGSSPNHECWRPDITVQSSWSRPVCSRATPCDSKTFTRVLSRVASSVSLRSAHRSTFTNIHSDPSNISAWLPEDMWRNQESFRRGWRGQLIEGHKRAHYLGSEFSFFASPVNGAHSSLIDCGLFTTMVTRFSCTSAVLAIFDSGQSSSFSSVRRWSFFWHEVDFLWWIFDIA